MDKDFIYFFLFLSIFHKIFIKVLVNIDSIHNMELKCAQLLPFYFEFNFFNFIDFNFELIETKIKRKIV